MTATALHSSAQDAFDELPIHVVRGAVHFDLSVTISKQRIYEP